MYCTCSVTQCKNFRDFSEVLVFPMFGHSSYEEMYSACCPSSRLNDITIPVLGLNAADDPFTPPHGKLTLKLYWCVRVGRDQIILLTSTSKKYRKWKGGYTKQICLRVGFSQEISQMEGGLYKVDMSQSRFQPRSKLLLLQ